MKLLDCMTHFEKQITEYAYRTGKTNAEAIASLLDFIISYFDEMYTSEVSNAHKTKNWQISWVNTSFANNA